MCLRPGPRSKEEYKTLWFVPRGEDEWQRCSAPGRVGQAPVAALRKCASCARVMYYSTTCQRDACTYRGAPYKELCRLATSLVDKTTLPLHPETASDLVSFYQRIDGNQEMEKIAGDFWECFRRLAGALGAEMIDE
ncbi:hypothetical protein C8J57DRAFT_1228893 [Mycena rebaudengoi]|nr:hypothetical protein C8J57DRAFT_1228893 [Mycena rebaudengoi]